MLLKLDPETRVFTSGTEGIFPCEVGNLFPFKVSENDFGTALIIDDGLSFHGYISENWEPLSHYKPNALRRNKTNPRNPQ